MPRSKNSKNSNTYHFKVMYFDHFNAHSEKYFRTCEEIQQLFKISRGTIYNIYTGITKSIKHPDIIDIVKLSPPIPAYNRILVEFD